MARRLLILLLILGLAPGTWLRSAVAPPRFDQAVRLAPLVLPPGCCRIGPLRVAAAWRLTSPNHHFGGYSALVLPAPGRMLALGDGGYYLSFPAPGVAGAVRIGDDFPARGWNNRYRDVEAAAWDPARHRLWLALETRNAVLRFDPRLRLEREVRPAAMRDWPENTGAETLARLPGGAFLILGEQYDRWLTRREHPALLFPGDPVAGAVPVRFRFRGPAGFRPTDAAALPDGRVLVVMRRLARPIPARFRIKLVLADPRGITPGAVMPGRELGEIRAPVPLDNYEGLAIAPGRGGRLVAWLISDDNLAAFQRTLLLRLEFDPADLPATQRARR